ncbi:MAG TPA: hypothetical protein PLI77_01890 [Bacteroidales bacterium]|nr:hypothetical protein [Bacteroidales bacterium]
MSVEIHKKEKERGEKKTGIYQLKFIVFLRVKNFTEKPSKIVTNFKKKSII